MMTIQWKMNTFFPGRLTLKAPVITLVAFAVRVDQDQATQKVQHDL